MIVTAGLLIDFGNSETRVILISGNQNHRFNLSNRFAELPAGYRVNSKYANGKTTIMRINDKYYANGAIVEREFTGFELRPTSLQSKTTQLVTDLTLNLVFAKALEILSQSTNTPVANLDVTFNLSALLPPLDHEVHESAMEQKLQAMNNVSTLTPLQMDVKFRINEVNIYSEAVAAFFGAFYFEDGLKDHPRNADKDIRKGDIITLEQTSQTVLAETEDNRKFAQGYVLVLDIGAGTTDVALFKDMELVESSKDTFKLGGNTVASNVSNELRKQFGFTPTSMERVISEGRLEEGAGEAHDVSHIVTAAKERYSRTMMEELRQYLERMTIQMPVVKGLLVAGGGSLASMYQGQEVSPSMSKVLISYLNTLAPRMEALDTEGKDLRDLNIEGLKVLHKYA